MRQPFKPYKKPKGDFRTPVPDSNVLNGEVTRDANLNAVEQTLSNNGTTVGNYVTAYIPEPTSTTLSLLALAALAVRRRRK